MSLSENMINFHAKNIIWLDNALGFQSLSPKPVDLESGGMQCGMFMLTLKILLFVLFLHLLAICFHSQVFLLPLNGNY